MSPSKLFSRPARAALLVRATTRMRRRWGLLGRIVARLLANRLASSYGIYLSPLAEIGTGLKLPHPVGIVIGDGVRIGDGVTLYQNVTLGRRSESVADYPDVANGATIYAGAVVLGAVRIGSRAVIGANAVVTRDVPDETSAAGIPARFLDKRPNRDQK